MFPFYGADLFYLKAYLHDEKTGMFEPHTVAQALRTLKALRLIGFYAKIIAVGELSDFRITYYVQFWK